MPTVASTHLLTGVFAQPPHVEHDALPRRESLQNVASISDEFRVHRCRRQVESSPRPHRLIGRSGSSLSHPPSPAPLQDAQPVGFPVIGKCKPEAGNEVSALVVIANDEMLVTDTQLTQPACYIL
jgi:hypothetical protein